MNKPDEFPEMSGISVVVVCEGGNVFCDAGGRVSVTDTDGKAMDAPEKMESTDIFQNFIDAVRSRKREEQYAECEETHISSALCHTGLISHRLGKLMTNDQILDQIKSDQTLTDRYLSMADHLKLNKVDISKETVTLGPMIKFNPETEMAEGNGGLDAAANKLCRREYRAPYIVPEVL